LAAARVGYLFLISGFGFGCELGLRLSGEVFLNNALTYPLHVHVPIKADPGSSICGRSVHLISGLGGYPWAGLGAAFCVSVFDFLSPGGSSLGRIATLSKFFV